MAATPFVSAQVEGRKLVAVAVAVMLKVADVAGSKPLTSGQIPSSSGLQLLHSWPVLSQIKPRPTAEATRDVVGPREGKGEMEEKPLL